MNSGSPHLLVKSLGEAGHIRLRGCVDRQARGRLKAGNARHVEKVTAPPLAHQRKRRPADFGQCLNVEVDLIAKSLGIEFEKLPTGPKPSVVYDQVDRVLWAAGCARHQSNPCVSAEVSLHHAEPVIPISNLLQTVGPARNKQRWNPSFTQLPGHFGANPTRRSGDEG